MPGDIEKARVHDREGHGAGALFLMDDVDAAGLQPREVCDRIGLNWLAARKLPEDGFLSFDPADVQVLTPSQNAELIFVGSLVVAGCDTAMLSRMLSNLPKPYAYRIGAVYYDWESRGWELLPRYESFRDMFQDWVEDLVDSGQMRKLEDLKTRLERAIRDLHRMSPW